MKRSLLIALATLALLAGLASAQNPAKPDVLGTWVGSAVAGNDGTQIEITVVIEKAAAVYAGKISDSTGMVPETPLRQIAFKDNKLTFEFDLVQGAETTLIKIELLYDKETLKGVWYDPAGDSGAIELALKK
jgi:hypothetical protein